MNKKVVFLLLLCTSFSMYGWEWFEKTIVKPIKKEVIEPVAKGVKTAVKETGKVVEQVGKGIEGAEKEVRSKVLEGVQIVKGQFEPLEGWILPDGRLRLDQVAYLGSHNSHANLQEGFVYNQQLWSFPKQLQRGIRHFLIDIWVGKKGKDKGKLLLCHGDCEKQSLATRAGKAHVHLKTYLEQLKHFLDSHPKEIVTLELESYAKNAEIFSVINSVPGLFNYLLTPAIYDPMKHGGKWPTLKWLVSKGKRLIMFNPGQVESYGFNTNTYMIRNRYGTYDLDKACRLRGDNLPNRTLYQLNYFDTVALPEPSPTYPIRNSPKQLQKVLARCEQKGVIPKGKTPNFIALDHVHKGNPMKWVNELNRRASQSIK